MKTYKDFFYQDLEIGDYVVTGSKYKNFGCSKIIKFTPKMVKIENIDSKKTKLAYPFDMLKVDPKLVTYYKLIKQK